MQSELECGKDKEEKQVSKASIERGEEAKTRIGHKSGRETGRRTVGQHRKPCVERVERVRCCGESQSSVSHGWQRPAFQTVRIRKLFAGNSIDGDDVGLEEGTGRKSTVQS